MDDLTGSDPTGPTSREVARDDSERGELVLRERRSPGAASVLELRANGVFVMDDAEVGTEVALARASLALLAHPDAVLVGGLGLGFTLREVLADARVVECTVVEIEPALVGWMRDGTVPYGPGLLADARLRLVVADLAVAVAETPTATLDLVLMDVDNGPGFLVHDTNAAVYEEPFLATVRTALRPGGAVAVWSSAEAPALREAMTSVFGGVTAIPLDVRLQDRDEQYWLYLSHR